MPKGPVPVALLAAALLLALALAGPPAWSPAVLGTTPAAAQSAGDEQYADPFAPGGQGGNSSSGHSSTPPKAAPTSTPAPAGAVAATTTPAPTAAAAQQNDQLPRTGGEPLLIALAGVALVIAGVVLRLRARGD
jgi:hypothetical protein